MQVVIIIIYITSLAKYYEFNIKKSYIYRQTNMYFVFPLYCERPYLCNIFTESFWKDLYLFGTRRCSAVSWMPISPDDIDGWPLFQIWTDPSGYCIIIVIRLSVRLSRAFFCGICLSGNLKLIWNIQQHWKNKFLRRRG